MREIEFRGKLSHSKQWVYGNLIIANNGDPYIIPFEVFEPDGHHLIIDSDNPFWVEPESVGQFTGLLDKNGKKIFEGDVVNIKEAERKYVVKFHNGCFKLFHADPKLNGMLWGNVERVFELLWNFEIIGNVTENPELLK